MLLLAVFLIAAGWVMLFKPDLVWRITEKWKSQDADEPSSLFVWSTRFGGFLCALAGIASFAAYILALTP